MELAKTFKEDCKPGEWEKERPRLRIIPAADGRLLTSDEAVLALGGVDVPGRTPVARALSDDTDGRRILVEVLKVSEPDDHFWQNELLAGGLIDEDDISSNTNVLVDLGIHVGDEALLNALGVVDSPEGTIDANCDEGALSRWRDACREIYKKQHTGGARWDKLGSSEFSMPSGWTLLPELSSRANAELTQAFLRFLSQDHFVGTIGFGHRTKTTYARIQVAHPLAWFLLTYGTVPVARTSRRQRVASRFRVCNSASERRRGTARLPALGRRVARR